MQLLIKNKLEFLVGGAYAVAQYTGIARDTKDFDLLLRPADVNAALSIWRQAGYNADFEFTHWLAKVRSKRACVDVIFRSGNGLATIDDIWFEEAREADIFGMRVRVAPPEELIWQKAYETQPNGKCCNGTLLSRIQYLSDVTSGGLLDAREAARCQMTPAEIQRWTAAGLELACRAES
jgi:hypothetical protein